MSNDFDNEIMDWTEPSKIKDNHSLVSDWEFLSWIHERLVFVHHENPSYDYMHRLKKIADRMEEEERHHY